MSKLSYSTLFQIVLPRGTGQEQVVSWVSSLRGLASISKGLKNLSTSGFRPFLTTGVGGIKKFRGL